MVVNITEALLHRSLARGIYLDRTQPQRERQQVCWVEKERAGGRGGARPERASTHARAHTHTHTHAHTHLLASLEVGVHDTENVLEVLRHHVSAGGGRVCAREWMRVDM